jgi:hypothetical protein
MPDADFVTKTQRMSSRLRSFDRTGPNCAGKFGWTKRICRVYRAISR